MFSCAICGKRDSMKDYKDEKDYVSTFNNDNDIITYDK